MNYESQKVTRTFKSEVGRFRLSYIVTNPVDGAVSDITATIHQVTVETVNEQPSETLVRVGSGCVTMASNRSYLSIDKFDAVPHTDRMAISAQFYADVNSVLTEAPEA